MENRVIIVIIIIVVVIIIILSREQWLLIKPIFSGSVARCWEAARRRRSTAKVVVRDASRQNRDPRLLAFARRAAITD